MKTSNYNYKNLPSLFTISCSVFSSYEIKSLEEYLSFVKETSGTELTPDDQRLLRDKREKLGTTYIIFPTSHQIIKKYNPLTETPNAFGDFRKITDYDKEHPLLPPQAKKRLKLIQKNILKWVTKHGLPYCSAMRTVTTHAIVDNARRHANEIELFLEEKLGRYAMLQETFLALACEANLADKFFQSEPGDITENTIHQYFAIFNKDNAADIDGLIKKHRSRTLFYTEIRNNLLTLLQKRINGHSKQITLSIDILDTRASAERFAIKFAIPDLLTALWYQFYTSHTNASMLRTCKECHQLFVPLKANQEYCPAPDKTLNSACKNRYNQRKFRERKKASNTQTE